MYKCKHCGNVKYFTELKHVATKLFCTDDGIPIPNLSQDILMEVVEIYCELCGASSEDNLILDDEGKPINLSEQEIPYIGYSG